MKVVKEVKIEIAMTLEQAMDMRYLLNAILIADKPVNGNVLARSSLLDNVGRCNVRDTVDDLADGLRDII